MKTKTLTLGNAQMLTREEMRDVLGGMKESIAQCTARVYKTAKDACDADSVCKTACDLIPSCIPSMATAAAGACVINYFS